MLYFLAFYALSLILSYLSLFFQQTLKDSGAKVYWRGWSILLEVRPEPSNPKQLLVPIYWGNLKHRSYVKALCEVSQGITLSLVKELQRPPLKQLSDDQMIVLFIPAYWLHGTRLYENCHQIYWLPSWEMSKVDQLVYWMVTSHVDMLMHSTCKTQDHHARAIRGLKS